MSLKSAASMDMGSTSLQLHWHHSHWRPGARPGERTPALTFSLHPMNQGANSKAGLLIQGL